MIQALGRRLPLTPTKAPAARAPVRKRVLEICAYTVVIGALLFGCAGAWQWPFGWAWLVSVSAFQVGATILVGARHPDLLEERSRIQPGTKWWDRILTPAMMLFTLAIYCVAGLDYRFHGVRPRAWLAVIAIFVAAAGMVLTTAAMLANRFFATTVRIQSERGHAVVSTGPYASIRHPGYAGALLFTVAAAPALGSAWACIPAALAVLALLVRMALEDRTLRNELVGYRQYAGRVRYWLIPGVL